MFDETALIDLVRDHEELYDKNHPDYINQLQRENIWKEISSKLGENGAVCKEKWSRLRDNFRRAMILRKKITDSGLKYNRPPKYYSRLKFLVPHLCDNTQCSLDKGENEEDDSESSQSHSPRRRKIMKRSNSTTELFTQEENEESNEQPTEELMIYDEPQPIQTGIDSILTDFFVNMANTVARFPLKKQLEIKKRLFHMVHNVEAEIAENGSDALFL